MAALDRDHILYVCSPKLRNLDELQDKHIYLADLPVYDTTREFILLNQLRNAELDIRYITTNLCAYYNLILGAKWFYELFFIKNK